MRSLNEPFLIEFGSDMLQKFDMPPPLKPKCQYQTHEKVLRVPQSCYFSDTNDEVGTMIRILYPNRVIENILPCVKNVQMCFQMLTI